MGNEFGCGVADGKDPAVFVGEDPATVGKGGRDFALVRRDGNAYQRVAIREQHAVIELADKRLEAIAEGDKVEDILVFIEIPLNGCFDAPIVAMQPFTDIAIERDEVRRAEDQSILGDADSPGG
jgi:hypothetical protein